jgi:hypothetical protein
MSQTKTQTATTKRINKVTLKRMVDEQPDSSYLEQAEFADRLRQYQGGQFCFLGVRAEAEILLPANLSMSPRERKATCSFVTQRITSGGLWGIESDSDDSYMREIESEELAALADNLHILGFSKRAVSAAFRNIERKEI